MKTPEELCKEIVTDPDVKAEFVRTLNDPYLTAAFLKKHGCDVSVSEFIALLDTYNG